ncbi:MAG TPA: DUF2268 domain-containing putative Zn-dependent protease [Reyranella sp.]|nr:DUF2268 domain-containing putative Zn-dependent protease [Reyranella sp.]
MQPWSFIWHDSLTPWRAQILSEIEATRETIAALVPTPALSVELRHAPDWVIPEIGMCGFCTGAGTFKLSFDPANRQFALSLADGTLRRQVAHEVHHCLRNAGPGYGRSLGEALVSEGLAGQFVNRLYGTPPEPWEKAVAPRDAWRFLPDDRSLGLPMYDHNAWFYGTGGYPRWLGYTLGYLLAGRWRALEPDANGERLVNATAAEVIAAARSFS